MNTLDQLNRIFQLLVIAMLGYTKTGSPAVYPTTAFSAVRISWPSGGQPAHGKTDDVVYVRIEDVGGAITQQKDDTYTTSGSPAVLSHEMSYTRVIEVNLAVCGPNSWTNARSILDQMFYQEYHDELAAEGLYLIPSDYAPRRVPEIFQGNWWERVDLALEFNEGVVVSRTIPYLESAEVLVYNKDGLLADITN